MRTLERAAEFTASPGSRPGSPRQPRGAARYSLVILGALALVLLALGGAALWAAFGPVEQPLAFNHTLHVGDLEMECVDCHLYAINGVRATIPNIEVCGDCHEEAFSESGAEVRLVEYVHAGERIPWRKIYRVPDHVYFSHRRHTRLAQLECETCHGPVGQRSEPVRRPLVRITMERCMACHETSGVSNDCLLCHR